MPSFQELLDLVRPVVDESNREVYLEAQIHMLEHLGKYLDRASDLGDVRDWQEGHLAFLKAAREL